MAGDREFILHPGRGGLNLRDDVAALDDGQLSTSLNFRISARGSMVKRLGMGGYSITDADNVILRIGLYNPAAAPNQIIAYCDSGVVQVTQDGVSWQEVATGLAPGVNPEFVQFLDKLYIANGVDHVQVWDGTNLTDLSDDPDDPFADEAPRHMTIWRNRLYLANSDAHPRRVWWSGPGDAEDWTNVATNFVDFPDGGPITAIATARSSTSDVSTLNAGDGVVVFDRDSMHRIYDDKDNIAGYTAGGANIMVDGSMGCSSQRSIAVGRGQLLFVGKDGVYTTDGHTPLKKVSRLLTPLFDALGQAELEDTDGCYHNGCYYLAYTPAGAANHSRLLELYLDQPRNNESQWPWMAHDLPLRSMVSMEDGTFIAADARSGDDNKLRQVFTGGGDISGSDELADVYATARTGMSSYGLVGQKLLRRIVCYGHGTFMVAAVSSDGSQEGGSFSMPITIDQWNPGETWSGKWGEGGASPVASDLAKYTRTGRFIALEIVERSQSVGPPKKLLGQTAFSDEGGMKITALETTITPLDLYR